MSEERLAGGNATDGVVRVGDTVRKPWTSATPATVDYLELLRRRGIDVPRHLGRDDLGRQVLEFVPGTLALGAPRLDRAGFERVGRMLRAIHDASPAPEDLPEREWDVLIPIDGADLICHNDLTPWNLVLGDRWAFIDWDGAGPSTRLWDLAYSAQAFAIPDDSIPVADAASDLRILVDAYGAGDELRSSLPDAMIRRAEAMHEHLRHANSIGWEPWSTMYLSGHGEHWGGLAAHLAIHRRTWVEVLA